MVKHKKLILAILVLAIISTAAGIIFFGSRTYFSDDFDKDKDVWAFHDGEAKPTTANIEIVDGNKVLRGVGYYMARLNKEWNDYSLKFRFKRIAGSMHVIFREIPAEMGLSRYTIGLGNDKGTAISLHKQLDNNAWIIERVESKHYRGWHTLEIRGRDNILNVYLDNEFLIKYKDVEEPILSGKIAFEVIRDSEFLIDDVEIKSVREKDVVEEIACPYDCCTDEFYNPKVCPSNQICYSNTCQLKGREIELLKDTRFEWGFAEFTENNLPRDKWCEMPVSGEEPVWTVAEVATETNFCNNLPNPKSTKPEILIESAGGHKKLYSYKDGRIKLQLDGSMEEKEGCSITNYESLASSWLHYGLTQYTSIDFTDLEELKFNLSVKLNKFEPNIYQQRCTKYGIDVERYGGFGIVFLLKRKGQGLAPENLYWIVIDSCSKHWWPGAYGRGEAENKECKSNSVEYIMKDQFGIPMYHPAMDNITSSANSKYPILRDDEWVNYDIYLKKLAQDAIDYYNIKYEPDINLANYELAHVHAGWEMMGAFDIDVELKDFSLKGKFVAD